MGLFFADEHATPASQMGDGVCELMDTPEVSALKDTDTYEGLLALGKALCYQLRYREAVEVYTKAVEMRPRDIWAYRQRGARYISTLRPFEAFKDFLRCRQLGGDEMDISYRLGLCHYLAGDYIQGMKELEQAEPLCDDEMAVAVIYWHTLCAWRAGRSATLLRYVYRRGMEVGHHTAYDFAMAVAAGYVDVDKALVRLKAEKDDLEYSIMAYGVAAVLKQDGRREEADELIREIVRRDGFWISYAYIAAWNDVSYQKGFLTK